MADAAKILDVIAGYDPKDDMTVLSVGRRPSRPYASFATAQRLDGLRIGVVREYLNKTLFSKADEQSIDLVERAIADLRKLGATVIDPGPAGSLFQACVAKSAPRLLNASFTRQFREVFPFDDAGQPSGDHVAKLLELAADPSRVPEGLAAQPRRFRRARRRPLHDEQLPARARRRQHQEQRRSRGQGDVLFRSELPPIAGSLASTRSAQVLDTSTRVQTRYAMQILLLECMQEQRSMRWSRRLQPFHRAS